MIPSGLPRASAGPGADHFPGPSTSPPLSTPLPFRPFPFPLPPHPNPAAKRPPQKRGSGDFSPGKT